MGLSKYELSFDPTDLESDKVGSYLISKSGEVIDHSDVGGIKGINVNVLNDLTVDIDHTEDSVRLGDGTNFFTSTTVGADVGLDVNLINASIAVTATDLDIRDLLYTQDSVTAHQGGTWIIDSITNSVTVTATDLDIRNLVFADDKVDVSGSVIETKPVGFASAAYGANAAVGTSATLLISSALSGRDKVLIQNVSNVEMYLGFSNAVTTSTGIKIPKGGSYEMELTDAVSLYGITASGTAEIRYQEMAA